MDLQLTYTTAPDGTKKLMIPDERRAAAIAFAQEAARKTPAEMEAIVQEGHNALCAAVAVVTEAEAMHKPSPDGWSVLELMAHVVSTKRIVALLCARLAQGQLPPGFTPQLEEERAQDGVTIARFETLAEARAAAESAHQDLLTFIRGIDAATNVDLRFRHFVFGALNCREWAVFQRLHDGDHTPQLTRIKAAIDAPVADRHDASEHAGA